MLNRNSLGRNLQTVDMLIRAVANEMAQLQKRDIRDVNGEPLNEVLAQMEEALYALRLRKMLLKALN
ncbi:MAG TPA: hypothetical protein VIG62_18725 [Blastocatellia bacterium]